MFCNLSQPSTHPVHRLFAMTCRTPLRFHYGARPIFGGSFQNFTSDAVLLPQQAKQIIEAKNLFQRIMTMQFRVSRGRCGRKVFRVTWPSMEKIPPGIYLVPVHALFFCPICLPPAQVAIGCQFSAKDVDHRDASSFSLEL